MLLAIAIICAVIILENKDASIVGALIVIVALAEKALQVIMCPICLTIGLIAYVLGKSLDSNSLSELAEVAFPFSVACLESLTGDALRKVRGSRAVRVVSQKVRFWNLARS